MVSMIRAVLIDDEKNNVENLQLLLSKHCPEVDVVATANSSDKGYEEILTHTPDLVFLDIQMPGKTGFDLLTMLPRFEFELVFVTAFDKYGIQAVKFAAIDYLLKPLNVNELKEAVAKVSETLQSKRNNRQLENLVQLLQNQRNKEE